MPRLAGVTAALNQGLQVGYNEAQRVQDDPGHDDALQPAGSFFNGSLIAGNHADQQCNGCDCDGNDGADGNDLTVNILQDRRETIPDGVCENGLDCQHGSRGHTNCGPVGVSGDVSLS